MSMERWEMIQRRMGNVAGAEMARTLRLQFGDVPPATAQDKPKRKAPRTSETPVEIVRFNPLQKETLERNGFVTYELTGQSISAFNDSVRQLRTTWHKDYPEIEEQPAMRSEVAIDPYSLFLPDSNRKTLEAQEAMVDEYSDQVGIEVEGAKAILGEAPDYAELAFAHLYATTKQGKGVYLFGKENGYDYTRTKTKIEGSSSVASVGNFHPGHGLTVSAWRANLGNVFVHAAPLIVPNNKI